MQPPLLSVALAAKSEMVKLVGEAQSAHLCPSMFGKWGKGYLLILASVVWGWALTLGVWVGGFQVLGRVTNVPHISDVHTLLCIRITWEVLLFIFLIF